MQAVPPGKERGWWWFKAVRVWGPPAVIRCGVVTHPLTRWTSFPPPSFNERAKGSYLNPPNVEVRQRIGSTQAVCTNSASAQWVHDRLRLSAARFAA